MPKFRFRKFPVYTAAIDFRKHLKELSKEKFPEAERFVLNPQLWRALDSIVLNIAEGADRSTDKDFAHFLNTAHASLSEVVACLDLAKADGYISENEQIHYIEEAEALANQLSAFRKSLLDKPLK